MRFTSVLAYLLLSTLFSSCQNSKEMNSNHLITETSPYLLQHAYNPVDWYPWSNVALEKAKDENKLVIVSIGYAACHWCHVMEHESFEDSTVADVMNKYYVSIKVDREERPDVDEVYMDAANVMTGRGGWPLNIIALPDGRPIFAGTYFSKNDWLKVLSGVQKFYEETPEKALEQAELIQQGVSQLDIIETTQNSSLSQDSIALTYTDWLGSMDMKTGGRRANMKFPMPLSYLAMLNYAVLHNDQQGKDAVLLTLNKITLDFSSDSISASSVTPLSRAKSSVDVFICSTFFPASQLPFRLTSYASLNSSASSPSNS
jgi:uncharacterized protein YyaL (SSP411 family)